MTHQSLSAITGSHRLYIFDNVLDYLIPAINSLSRTPSTQLPLTLTMENHIAIQLCSDYLASSYFSKKLGTIVTPETNLEQDIEQHTDAVMAMEQVCDILNLEDISNLLTIESWREYQAESYGKAVETERRFNQPEYEQSSIDKMILEQYTMYPFIDDN